MIKCVYKIWLPEGALYSQITIRLNFLKPNFHPNFSEKLPILWNPPFAQNPIFDLLQKYHHNLFWVPKVGMRGSQGKYKKMVFRSLNAICRIFWPYTELWANTS